MFHSILRIFKEIQKDVPIHDNMSLIAFVKYMIDLEDKNRCTTDAMYVCCVCFILSAIKVESGGSVISNVMRIKEWQETASKRDINRCIARCITLIEDQIENKEEAHRRRISAAYYYSRSSFAGC